jgi:hypothetical protein
VIEFTASNTESCVIAIALTACGVACSFDAISAALAFASVTTSARAVPELRSTTRQMLCMLRPIALRLAPISRLLRENETTYLPWRFVVL